MKRLIPFFFLINFITANAQEKNEIYVRFDKEYRGNVTIDSLENGRKLFFIEHKYISDYIKMEVINDEKKVVEKSFLRKVKVITVTNILDVDIQTAARIFENKKVYVIDPDELKKKKNVIREVKVTTESSH